MRSPGSNGSREDLSKQGDNCDVVPQDMVFDPFRPLRRFAVGLGGAFMTDDGVTWIRLLHAGALPGRPANCYYDQISDPDNPALYVAFADSSLNSQVFATVQSRTTVLREMFITAAVSSTSSPPKNRNSTT